MNTEEQKLFADLIISRFLSKIALILSLASLAISVLKSLGVL